MVDPARPCDAPALTEARRSRARARRRIARVGSAIAGLASAAALAWPSAALAEPPDERPWGRGVLRPSFGLSAGGLFNQETATLGFGLGFNYFIVNGLSAGLSLSDTIFIYRSAFKAQYPGIETTLPTNMIEVTPTVQYVFFRSRRFSPYVYGGVGPVFFNHGAGTHGQWVGGPGAYLNVTGPLYVSVGVGFSGLFPAGRCKDALTYQPADPLDGPVPLDLCSFRWGPQVGLALAFGGGQRRREPREPRAPRREPPPPYEPEDGPPHDAVPARPVEPPHDAVPARPVEPPHDADPTPTDEADPATTSEPEPTESAPTDVALPPGGVADGGLALHSARRPVDTRA